MIPTLAERIGVVATEVTAAVLRTKVVPISKFGISSVGTPARNARLLNQACADVDDGTVISMGQRWYPIDQGVVRIMRGSLELRGPGYQKGGLEYTSITDNTVGVGNCITVGIDKPELVPAGATGVCKDVTVRGLGFRDLNRTAFDFATQKGHWPSALEFLFVENPLVDGCGFQNVKGNSGLNLLGLSKSPFDSVTQLATVQYCWFGGDPLGGYTQGDGANAGGYAKLVFTGNATQGGIGRHFLELGTGVLDVIVQDSIADMNGGGDAHIGSMTASRSAIIRRNRFSNWGATSGASAIPINPDAPDYGPDETPIFTSPDGTPLPLNQVVGVAVEDNVFTGGPTSWPAAIAILAGDLRNHVYRRNTFNCPLAFYLVKQPVDGFEISGNDYTPDTPGRNFIALGAGLEAPTSQATISGNTLRKSATLFDRGTWAADARVTGVGTNIATP